MCVWGLFELRLTGKVWKRKPTPRSGTFAQSSFLAGPLGAVLMLYAYSSRRKSGVPVVFGALPVIFCLSAAPRAPRALWQRVASRPPQPLVRPCRLLPHRHARYSRPRRSLPGAALQLPPPRQPSCVLVPPTSTSAAAFCLLKLTMPIAACGVSHVAGCGPRGSWAAASGSFLESALV